MQSTALVATYFGRLPEWIDDFVESCKYNPTITWHLFSDGRPPQNRAGNFNFIPMALADFNSLAFHRLGVRTAVCNGYKTCDFRPTYGVLFDDYLQGFDFWGHCDLDVIWGDLRAFFTDPILESYDVLSTNPSGLCGPLTIFRNRESINYLYRRAPYEQILLDDANRMFDESFSTFVEEANRSGELRLFASRLHEYDGYHSGIPAAESPCVWRAGRLFCTIENRELMYYHFAGTKRWPCRTTWSSSGV
jgi:hypothetical protein